MGDVAPISKEFKHGGARPGAGRPRLEQTPAFKVWASFERRLRGVTRAAITREKLLELAREDPWRFIERIVIPVLALEKRQAMRVGVNVDEPGGRRVQFVLDFGDAGEASEAELAGQVLEAVQGGERDR